VGFSRVDLASHKRGYPALLDITNGEPVGALVFAQNAVAGSVWTRDGADFIRPSHIRRWRRIHFITAKL
jgi:hypothetical protein